MIKASIVSLLFVFWFTTDAAAQAQTDRRGASNIIDQWPAVGRLTSEPFDGPRGCTATLITPDLILTAGHCIGSLVGKPEQLAAHYFYAGLADGAPIATRALSAVFVSPKYALEKLTLENIKFDWAVARLAEPIENITPLPIGSQPGPWETVSFVAYSRLNTTTPLTVQNCPQRTFQDGVLIVGCEVIGGNSGAPVIVGTGDLATVIAVISATASPNALAVLPDADLRDLLQDQ